MKNLRRLQHIFSMAEEMTENEAHRLKMTKKVGRPKANRETWSLKQWTDWLEENSEKVMVVKKLGNCWEWQRALTGGDRTHRYAMVHYDERVRHVNRITFEKQGNVLTPKIHVRHKCDHSKCVNPNHLELGSHQDNVDDMVQRGRQAKGTDNGRVKLTSEQVLEIREKYKDKSKSTSQRELAREYGVHQTLIGFIVREEIWKHI